MPVGKNHFPPTRVVARVSKPERPAAQHHRAAVINVRGDAIRLRNGGQSHANQYPAGKKGKKATPHKLLLSSNCEQFTPMLLATRCVSRDHSERSGRMLLTAEGCDGCVASSDRSLWSRLHWSAAQFGARRGVTTPSTLRARRFRSRWRVRRRPDSGKPPRTGAAYDQKQLARPALVIVSRHHADLLRPIATQTLRASRSGKSLA